MAGITAVAGVILAVFCCTFVAGFEKAKLYGVSHIAITVADLNKATDFYVGLGGMKVDKLSTDGVFGDALYYSMFQKQILQQQTDSSKSLADFAVCDCKATGTEEVAWNFVLFDANLLQLVQCQKRGTDTPVNYHRTWYKAAGAAGSYGHMALWVHSEADAKDFSSAVLELASSQNLTYQGFQTVDTPPATEAERTALCRDDMTKCMYNMGEGFILTASRGADGEKLEWSCRDEQLTPVYMTSWCGKGAIQKEMMDLADRKEPSSPATAKLVGFHHIEQTVTDRYQTRLFYENVLGAKYGFGGPFSPLIDGQESFMRGLVFQDDEMEARRDNIPDTTNDYAKFGILKNWGSSIQSNIDFYYMDNIYLETYHFYGTTEQGQNEVNMAKPDLPHLSPGYVRSFVTGFWLYDDEDFDQYSAGLEMNAFLLGMDVRTNRADGADPMNRANTPNSVPMTSGDLEGYNFVYFNSPNGDTFSLVEFKGKAREALREAMVSYGAISKAFDEVNPLKKGQQNSYCCGRNVSMTLEDLDVSYCPKPTPEAPKPQPCGGAGLASTIGALIAMLAVTYSLM